MLAVYVVERVLDDVELELTRARIRNVPRPIC